MGRSCLFAVAVVSSIILLSCDNPASELGNPYIDALRGTWVRGENGIYNFLKWTPDDGVYNSYYGYTYESLEEYTFDDGYYSYRKGLAIPDYNEEYYTEDYIKYLLKFENYKQEATISEATHDKLFLVLGSAILVYKYRIADNLLYLSRDGESVDPNDDIPYKKLVTITTGRTINRFPHNRLVPLLSPRRPSVHP
jgi:hypothetical protein